MYRKSGGYDLIGHYNTLHITGFFVFTALLNSTVFNVRTAYSASAWMAITADTIWRQNIPFAFQTVMLIFKFVGTWRFGVYTVKPPVFTLVSCVVESSYRLNVHSH